LSNFRPGSDVYVRFVSEGRHERYSHGSSWLESWSGQGLAEQDFEAGLSAAGGVAWHECALAQFAPK